VSAAYQERNCLLELSLFVAGTRHREKRRAQGGIDRSHPQRLGFHLGAFQSARGVRLLG